MYLSIALKWLLKRQCNYKHSKKPVTNRTVSLRKFNSWNVTNEIIPIQCWHDAINLTHMGREGVECHCCIIIWGFKYNTVNSFKIHTQIIQLNRKKSLLWYIYIYTNILSMKEIHIHTYIICITMHQAAEGGRGGVERSSTTVERVGNVRCRAARVSVINRRQ